MLAPMPRRCNRPLRDARGEAQAPALCGDDVPENSRVRSRCTGGVVFGVKASFWSLVEAGVQMKVGKGSNRVGGEMARRCAPGRACRGGTGPLTSATGVLKPVRTRGSGLVRCCLVLVRIAFFQCVMPQRLQGTAPRARSRTRATITRFGRPAREPGPHLLSRNADGRT